MCHGPCEPGKGCAGVHVSIGASESHRAQVAGRLMEIGESGAAVSWRAARNDARNRSTHAVAARLVVLGLAVTVGMATLIAVFSESTGRSVSAPQRMALLQSQVTALREQDFEKAPARVAGGKSVVVQDSQSSAHPAVGVRPSVGVSSAAPAAQPVAGAQVSGLARAEAQVATVVPKLNSPKMTQAATVPNTPVLPPPAKAPPAVKLNKQTQKQLEVEIRALRQAQEEREMKFMKEAAVATANEIARDKHVEEKKAVISHQEHVNEVALSKMHVQQEWKAHGSPRSTATNEVENVLQKAIDAQEKHAKVKGATKVSSRNVAKAKAMVKKMTAPKLLSPAEQKALKAKEAAEARLKAAEKAKVDKMAAKMEARQAHETAMIETRPGDAVAEKPAIKGKKQVVKLTAKEEEKIELQKRVERMLKHTDQVIAQKDEEARVLHAKKLLEEEVAAAKAKSAEEAAAKKQAEKASKVREQAKEAAAAAATRKVQQERKAAETREAHAKAMEVHEERERVERGEYAQREKAARKGAAENKAEGSQLDTRASAAAGKGSKKAVEEARVKEEMAEKLREAREVEVQKVKAEAKQKLLKEKIAALHKLLHEESAQASTLQEQGLKAYDKAADPAGATRAGNAERQRESNKLKAWTPAAKAMAPEDHTSRSALKQGLLVADKVMKLMAARREARREARHPSLLRREEEKRMARKELRRSSHIISAAEEEHAAGLDLSPGQASAEEFGAFA